MTDLTGKQVYDRARYQRLKADRLSKKLPDPIELLIPEELAYIAGLIDGEGTIYVGYVGPKRRSVYPHVGVAMTHYDVLQWFGSKIGAGTIKLNNHTNRRRYNERIRTQRPQFIVKIFGRKAQLLCQRILPYLKVKQQQARLVTQFPVDTRSGPGNYIPDEIQAIRMKLREQINGLNHTIGLTWEEWDKRRSRG